MAVSHLVPTFAYTVEVKRAKGETRKERDPDSCNLDGPLGQELAPIFL